MALEKLWTELYRPSTVDNYVFQDKKQEKQIRTWIEDSSIPHLIFWGSPGTGKTTLAKVLISELMVDDNDVLYINASKENGVDLIRDKITRFSEIMPWGDFKVIMLDEADYLSPNAQAALRGVMEQYSSSVRFILTLNHYNLIIEAVKSRCQTFHISNQDKVDFTARVAEILIDQGINFELEVLDSYVRAVYPDLRKTINLVQQNVIDSELVLSDSNSEVTDWMLKVVEFFQDGEIRKARELICKSATPEDYEGLYTFLYRNLDFFGKTPEQQDEAIIIIRNSMVKHTQIADPEINLSACLIELMGISK